MTPRDRSVQDLRGKLVQVAFLVRLLALSYGLLGLVLDQGERRAEAGEIGLFVLLVLTSHLGLQHHRVRELIVRHPVLALLDLVPVSLTPLVMGPSSPLVLVVLSSALLIGVLFTIRTAVPLVALLVASTSLAGIDSGISFVASLRDPVVMLSFAALGAAIRRQSEQQVQVQHDSTLALQAAAAAEERLRLARDLHDTVAKSIQGVALTASALPRWMERDPAIAARQAQSVADAAKQAVTAARNLLTSLRMDDPNRPFADVVDEFVYRWEAASGIEAQRLIDDVPPIPPGHRHELLSAVSEALENIVRHAPEARVTVSLEHVRGRVVATVVDDGPGFTAEREEDAVADGHYGLTGIRERLETVRGNAVIRSAPGFGTQVRLEVPVVAPPPAAPPAPAATRRQRAVSARTREGVA